MKKHVFGVHVFGVGMMGLAAIAGFSAITMLLWNWLVPGIFGFAAINFWQALGLLVLARILFGGIGGKRWMRGRHMGMHKHHNPIREKWMKMTPEERQEFVKDRRFGHHPFEHDFGHCRRDFDDRFNTEEPEKKD
ncbi:MAG: hypothetical protein LBT25_03380 [Candidatus Symbiothrix sp.]|jgi:hypothetical protein|nr:hypothetical protein [Candidatus Symbiothrix sp.]